jgi:hypothetical protein
VGKRESGRVSGKAGKRESGKAGKRESGKAGKRESGDPVFTRAREHGKDAGEKKAGVRGDLPSVISAGKLTIRGASSATK